MKLPLFMSELVALITLTVAAPVEGQLPVQGYTPNNDELLLGFTIPPSTGDLVIDLGTASQVGVDGNGVVDLIAHQNVGQSASALVAQLNQLYGNMNGLEWGIVGGHYKNDAESTIYCTVPHGAAPPKVGGPGPLKSAINTVGQGLTDLPGMAANQAIVDPTQGYGESWTEQIAAPGSVWERNATSPNSTTPGSFSTGGVKYQLADLYIRTNSATYPPTYRGYFTLGSDGSLSFTPASTSPPAAPPPPLLNINRTGSTSTISFVSTNGAIYSLYYTNYGGLIAPVTNWPLSGTTITGNGGTQQFSDTTPDPGRVYRVMAR